MHYSPEQPVIDLQPSLLRLVGITKRFGGVTALDGVELDMQAGQVLGLLGANGSGKSTLSRIIAGELAPDSGEVAVQGSPVVRSSIQAAASHGIVIAHQHPSLPPDLPVWEAMFLGAEYTRAGFVDRSASRRKASAWLQQLGGGVAVDARCGELSAAARQMVEIARALSRQPRLLILDEPTAALAAAEVKRLFACVRSLARGGTGVIFISHRLAEVEALCDAVLVLRNGCRVGSWSLAGALDEARILTLMTGDPPATIASPVARSTGEIVLAVRALQAPPAVRGAEIELRTGEVLGLSGLQGQGQEELLEVLAGLRRPTAGEIRFRGQPIRARLPRDMIGRGICLVPNDRHRQGLFMGQTVGDNLGYVQVALGRAPWRLPRAALQRFARQMIDRLQIKTSGPGQPVGGLSGGNQQKIVVGKWLGCNLSVLLLSDPTKGVDIRARSEIYAALRTLAAQGCAVLVFASDMQELLQHCDRILVMCEGRVVDSLLGEAMSESRIMAASFGKIAA